MSRLTDAHQVGPTDTEYFHTHFPPLGLEGLVGLVLLLGLLLQRLRCDEAVHKIVFKYIFDYRRYRELVPRMISEFVR